MRPNVATTRDPLNAKALPPTSGMEFDYRTQVFDDALNTATAIRYSLYVSLWGLGVAVALRMAGMLTATPLFLAIATASGVIFAIVSLALEGPSLLALASFVFGPLVWLFSVAVNTSLMCVLTLVTLLCATHLAHHMAQHYARWMHANIYLPREVRQRWLAVWKPAAWYAYLQEVAFPSRAQRSGDDFVRLEEHERARYALGFAAVIAAFLLAALVYVLCLPAPLAGFVAVSIFVIALLVYGVVQALNYAPTVTPELLFRVLKNAYVSWFTYNVHHTKAPGVFRSPSGFFLARFIRTAVTLFLIAISVLPIAAYFPLGLPIFGYEPWLQTASAPMPLIDLSIEDYLRGRDTQTYGSPSSTSADLTETQRQYIENLPPRARDQAGKELIDANRMSARLAAGERRLTGRPEAMLLVYVRGLISLDPRIILSAALAFVACMIAPPALFAAVWLAIAGRVLVHHFLTLEGDAKQPARYHATTRPFLWDAYVHRLRESQYVTRAADRPDVRERDHFLMGFFEEEDYPILLSPAVLSEHAHITGDSGAGKSSLGIAPLIDQIIDRGEDSIVVFDLKGDMALFESVRAAVEKINGRRGPDSPAIPFRWFTNRPDCATNVFNPFLQEDMQRVTPHQKVEILLKSLGLDYGEGYGTSYYSSVHRFVLDRLLESEVRFDSFQELNEYFRDASNQVWKDSNIRPRLRDDATHLYTTVNSLASFDALNATPRHGLPADVMEHRIDMGKVVRSPHIVYFYMHAALEEAAVRAVAKLALHSLLVAAVRRGASKHRVYAFVDEFQQVVSEDLQIFLRQARSANIPVILANQTISDLRTKAVDLIPTVQGSTRFRQVFSSSDLLQQQMLIDASGEAIYETHSWSERPASRRKHSMEVFGPLGSHEQIGPRLRRNDVIQASDEELTSIVHVTRGHGFSQFGGFPFPARSMFHVPLHEYRKRQNASWPLQADHPGTYTPPVDGALPAAIPGRAPLSATAPKGVPSAVQKEFSDLEQRIDDLEETIR